MAQRNNVDSLNSSLSLIVILLFVGSFSDLHGQPTFTVVDLGTLTTPTAINNNGRIVGSRQWTNPARISAFEWAGGTFERISTEVSQAYDINNNDIVVGNITDASGYVRGFMSKRTAGTRVFSLVDPDPSSISSWGKTEARGINDAGMITGVRRDRFTDTQLIYWPTWWDASLGYHFIVGFAESQNAIPACINGLGQVVINHSPSGDLRVYYFEPAFQLAIQLPDLSGGSRSSAFGNNQTGVIVGKSLADDGKYHAVIWRNQNIVDLSALGGIEAEARSINSSELIVGTITLQTGAQHAFIWQNGLVLDLNNANLVGGTGWVLKSALDVNDNGWIIGEGFRNFEAHGFLLTPGGTSVPGQDPNLPAFFELHQNFPNPFNPSTTVEFTLPRSSVVTLKIYDIYGEEVATLASEMLAAGRYTRVWDASRLASGVYLLRLTAGGFVKTRKLTLLR